MIVKYNFAVSLITHEPAITSHGGFYQSALLIEAITALLSHVIWTSGSGDMTK